MDKSYRMKSLLLFLLGLGTLTQIYFYGCLAFSELVIFFVAPVLYVTRYQKLRRMGFCVFINMLFGVIAALFVSSWYNDTAYPFVIKSLASIYSVFSYFIVLAILLKDNFNGLRWFLIGIFLSSLVTIVAFNPSAQVSESGFSYVGSSEVEDIIEGALFWTEKFKRLVQIPICGFYYQYPTIAAILTPVAYIAVVASTTVSGRASSVAFILSGVMIIIGRKKRKMMGSIGRHFFIFLFMGVLFLFAIKQGYVYAAEKGMLGADAQSKYERQSRKGTGLLRMLMSGRMGFFTAIPAAVHRPIIGYGPYAEDKEGYACRFVMEYGDDQDVKEYLMNEQRAMAVGYRRKIPTHSYIMGAWINYGLFGLIFYLWVLSLLYQHVKKFAAAIPQWYGYFAMMIPYYLWNIFFSPFGNRWEFAMLMTCIFYARAIGRGMIQLPEQLEWQAREYDGR